MRRALTAMIALALLALVPACGGGAHRAGTVSSGRGGASAGRPRGALSAGEAAAFARAVELRSSDLPGFTSSRERHHQQTAAEKRAQEELRTCVGAPAQSGDGQDPEASSPSFTREGGLSLEVVSSGVEDLGSRAGVAGELALVRSARTRACLERYMTGYFGRLQLGATRVGKVTVSAFRPSAPGTAGGFGWHVRASLSLHGVTIPLRLVLLGFGYRSVVVTLIEFGFPHIPADLQERLVSLLVARAESFPNAPPTVAARAQPA